MSVTLRKSNICNKILRLEFFNRLVTYILQNINKVLCKQILNHLTDEVCMI